MKNSSNFLQTHNPEFHKTVLIREVLEYLDPQPGKVYVDATFGGGGHTRAILTHEPNCKVIAFDWDENAIECNGNALLEEFGDRLDIIWSNFTQMPKMFKKYGYDKVDGILVDFGTSQFQIKERQGFSFAQDTALDMRMSPPHFKTTAADIVNYASEKELVAIFQDFGEERYARTIARAIVQERQKELFATTGQLVALIKSVVPLKKGPGIHPATRVFQALRIVVNKELDNIKTFLHHVPQVLEVGGRLVCISFHSLEDRLVKHYFKDHGQNFELLTPHVVVPSDEEVACNQSSRSSKLRAAKRIA